MKLDQRSRHAINAMIDLALHENRSPISLAELSRNQSVSVAYLELVFSKLKKSGLVEATRGPGGGYLLGPKGAEVSIADIVTAVVGGAHLQKPLQVEAGGFSMPDMTQGIRDGLHLTTMTFLQSIILSTLASQRKRKELPVASTSVSVQVVDKRISRPFSKAKVQVLNADFVLGQVWQGKR